MMKKMKRKGIAGILSAVLIIAGAIVIGTPGNKVLAEETITNLDKFLHVKWQVSENEYQSTDEKTVKDLRIVSTIDADEGEKYGNVGFEITFLEDPNGGAEVQMHHRVKSVFHRIAAKEGGIKYEYGPKAFHATSEWLATCTITEIPTEYWDNGILVKPYVTLKGSSTRYYGEHRYLTMQDIEKGIITLPVKDQLTNPTVSEVDSSKVDSKYYDGYTYMRVTVDDLSELPSISQYTVQHDDGAVDVKYRYLMAGAEDCGNTVTDHSWYTKSEGDNKVIVTPSEMRSFMVLSKTSTNGGSDKNFAGETIYLGADITLDKNTLWNSIGATNLSETYGKYFAGHFDGNMHTIAGVTVNKTTGRVYGLFGEVKGANTIVENFILSDSSFTISTEQTNTYSGCVVGSLNQGTVRNVKCDSTVTLTIGKSTNHYNGGLVGRAIEGVIENCWFGGRIEGSGTYQGGILGGLYNSGATCTIEQCLFTGNIVLNPRTGGICGDVYSEDKKTVSTLTIRDTLFAGKMSKGSDGVYKGLFIGNVASSAASVVADNLYGESATTFGTNIKNIGWADTTGNNANRTIDAEVTHLALADFNGATGYLNIDLDYYVPEDHEDGTWVIVEGKAPHLKVFGDVAGEQYIDIRTIGEGTNDARTVWYKATDDKEETFILYSPADFRGFQELSLTYDFAPGGVQDTVKLGADIDLNPGWRSSAPNETECIPWEPIGSSGMNSASTVPEFAGIFDGDMHSIRGVYINEGVAKLGLFGQTAGKCEIKNLELKNSYIYSSTDYSSLCRTGAIVGNLTGSICNVKCDEDVVVVGQGRCVGGIAGTANNATIEKCWFAGKVQMAGTTKDSGQRKDMGGILGGMFNTSGNTECTIENCLVTGELDIAQAVGGICGIVYTNSTLHVSDTLFAGNFVSANTTTKTCRGTVLGDVKEGSITLTNVYVKDGTGLSVKIGDPGTNKDTGITVLQPSELTGNAAYANMYLDFYDKDKNSTGAWFAVENSSPILTGFADTSKALAVTFDTYWFDAESEETSYTLNSVAEFRGFQKLAARNNFHEIEIKLGTDINLNPDWTASEKAPTIVWTPIGRLATNTDSIIPFRGTFNGQGHTIKGVYVSSSSDRIGLFATTGEDALITDFTLENSYIKNTNETTTAYASTGSIVGRLGGTLDTVKSSAKVVASGAQYTGGLVGDINSSVGATITNCWFAGYIGGTGSHQGQLLGGVRNVSGSDTKNTCTVTHCLATGTIDFKANTGGLVGAVWNDGTTLNISDSLYAGTFSSDYTGDGNHGSVVGNARTYETETATVTVTVNVTNVYVQKDCGFPEAKKIGNVGSSTHNEEQKANVKYVEKEGLYLDDARENTELSIYPQGKDTNSDEGEKLCWWYVSETHPVLASFGTPVTYDKLKVATYNIKYCTNQGDSSTTMATILNDVTNFIDTNNIDVCLLQEVDFDCERSGRLNQAEEIAKKMGQLDGTEWYYTFAKTYESILQGYYSCGIAIVSKYPITSSDAVPIKESGQKEERAILKAMINVNGTEVAVINTHVDDTDAGTSKAIEEAQKMINAIPDSTPIIFGGDLNDTPSQQTPIEIAKLLQSTTAGRNANTHPASNATMQIDYIFISNHFTHGYAAVLDPRSSDETLGSVQLSDHKPLVVSLYSNIKQK